MESYLLVTAVLVAVLCIVRVSTSIISQLVFIYIPALKCSMFSKGLTLIQKEQNFHSVIFGESFPTHVCIYLLLHVEFIFKIITLWKVKNSHLSYSTKEDLI